MSSPLSISFKRWMEFAEDAKGVREKGFNSIIVMLKIRQKNIWRIKPKTDIIAKAKYTPL